MTLRRDSIAWDAVAGALFAIGGVLDAILTKGATGPLAGDIAVALVLAGLVVVRRKRAFAAGLGALAAIAIQGLFFTPPPELTMPFFVLVLFPYASGAYERGARSWAIVAAVPVVVTLVDALDHTLTGPDVAFPTAMGLASWTAGSIVRRRGELAAELHETALREEEEREARARRAVGEERRRIAREMHDVVGHSISVMVVQAGGARRIIDGDPARAARAAAEIERTGRDALQEMRLLLGAFGAGDDGAARAPAPTFGAVATLVERARSAGLPAELVVEGAPRSLPPGIDVSAYRVVQEALTNALRHAPGAPTTVTVRWHPGGLELEIADRGPGPSRQRAREARGHGLIGMRERVTLYGGELRTGRRRGGGFEVHARLPLEAEVGETSDAGAVPA